MKGKLSLACSLILALGLICPTLSPAQQPASIKLLEPQTNGGRPLMQALKDRKSTKGFRGGELPMQVLSNLLWAAFGINRPDIGKRTAPSAMNRQEIDIYVAAPDGLYLYDAKAHRLELVLAKDIRAMTGTQGYVASASVNLVYVADFTRMGVRPESEKIFYSAADTGFIAENVYLYCASEGLGAVVRGAIDRPALAKLMGLRPDKRITLAQSVGYPRERHHP